MTNHAIRKALFVLVATSLSAFAAESAYADKTKKVDMKFAGTLLLNLEQQQFNNEGVALGTTFTSITQAKAVGSLGRADVNVAAQTGPPLSGRACPDGFFPIADIVENNIVFIFRDLSLLYGNGQGVVCLSGDDFTTQFVSIDGAWIGGTKRFANAEGEFSIINDTMVRISPNTQFSAESGRITGFVTGSDRHHDDDDD